MNEATGLARRYHWHSAAVRDFTCAPHTAIVGEPQGEILNLVDAQAAPAQTTLLEMTRRPEATLAEARHLAMPRRHAVRGMDLDLKRLGAVLAVAYERDLRDFASLLLVENLGPGTLESLALVAEVVHGAPSRFRDPARFSFAHGGKDGHPFPAPLKIYDESIGVLERALEAAKVDGREKLEGFARLHRFVQAVENRSGPEADFDAVVAYERRIAPALDGRTARGRAPAKLGSPAQMRLF